MSGTSTAKKTERKRMSHAEIEQAFAKAFPETSSACAGLCGELEHYDDLYDEAVQIGDVALEKRYLILLNAISKQIAYHKCECLFQ